jgi:hypothetical protein
MIDRLVIEYIGRRGLYGAARPGEDEEEAAPPNPE